ncbi:hypothetical protein [Thermomonospora umbrina]|uniref:Uncharacterized protein n=1 Tax=Thermomonospora umbrina TaxID=111806 RepID=A0A3D9SLP7_9ACTN|nr:hypothetical protein [Thermomonospora umbrina]REE96647.1 hypothetical protein DFJ69_2087 [Thermomonospora umbrina]
MSQSSERVPLTDTGRRSGSIGQFVRWLLPEDGIVDEIAVEVAAAGTRQVALTRTERELAAARILAAGGNATDIARRLFISYASAKALAARIAQENAAEAASPVLAADVA